MPFSPCSARREEIAPFVRWAKVIAGASRAARLALRAAPNAGLGRPGRPTKTGRANGLSRIGLTKPERSTAFAYTFARRRYALIQAAPFLSLQGSVLQTEAIGD
jgi:hypothetical protein